MSPSSTILTKQSDDCVFKFTEERLRKAARNPYEGGNTFLKFVRSKVDKDLIIAGEGKEVEKTQTFRFIQGEDDKIYSIIPGIPHINKSEKKRVPGTGIAEILEYTDREYLVF